MALFTPVFPLVVVVGTKDGHAVPELVDPLCQQNSLMQSSLNCGQTCGDLVNTKNFHFADK